MHREGHSSGVPQHFTYKPRNILLASAAPSVPRGPRRLQASLGSRPSNTAARSSARPGMASLVS